MRRSRRSAAPGKLADALLDLALETCQTRADIDRLLALNAAIIEASGIGTADLMELCESLDAEEDTSPRSPGSAGLPAQAVAGRETAEVAVDVAMASAGAGDGIPDFATDEKDPAGSEAVAERSAEAQVAADPQEPGVEERDFRIDPKDKSGNTILAIFLSFIAEARGEADLDRMVECNGPAIRKMTGKQLQAMTSAKSSRARSFAG